MADLFNKLVDTDEKKELFGILRDAVDLDYKVGTNRVIFTEYLMTKYPFMNDSFLRLFNNFRLNNKKCLEMYPDVSFLAEKYPNFSLNELELKVYEKLEPIFEEYILLPYETKLMKIVSNNPQEMNLFQLNRRDEKFPFIMSWTDSRDTSQIIDQSVAEMGLPKGNYVYIEVTNLDGPFDEDPDNTE